MSSANISASERATLLHSLTSGSAPLRPDGRGARSPRPFTVSTGVLPQCAGSARLIFPSPPRVEIVAAVRPSIVMEGETRLVLSATVPPPNSLSVGGGTVRDVRRARSDASSRLSRLLSDLLLSGVDDSCLSIGGRHAWRLSIDVSVLSTGGGNWASCADAASAAVWAALGSTSLPRTFSGGDGNAPEFVLDGRGTDSSVGPRLADSLPLCATAATVRGADGRTAAVLDPSEDERAVACGIVVVAVSGDGMVSSVKTLTPEGGGGIGTAAWEEAVEIAVAGSQYFHLTLVKTLEKNLAEGCDNMEEGEGGNRGAFLEGSFLMR